MRNVPLRRPSRRRSAPVPCTILATVAAFAAVLAVAVLPAPEAAAQGRLRPEDRSAILRSESVFDPQGDPGELLVEASFLFRAETAAGQSGDLTVVADLTGAVPDDGGELRLRVSLVAEDRAGEVWIRHHETVVSAPSGGGPEWSFEAVLELPSELRDLVVVVEELESGLWGAAAASREEEVEAPPGALASMRGGVWAVMEEPGETAAAGGSSTGAGRRGGAAPASASAAAGSAEASALQAAATPRSSVIRILPLRSRRPQGPTRVETLISDPGVSRVVFLLDGKQAAETAKEPFDARLSFTGPDAPQRLEVRAYGAGGERDLLGTDEIVVNETARAFRVRLAKVRPAAGGALDVEAEVAVPARLTLDRVELYLDQTLAATLTEPPYQARIEPGQAGVAGGGTFVRAVAYLADGSSVEDVSLLGAEGLGEEVDVRLVELYAVVTDKDGRPVEGLSREDFRLRYRGQEPAVERLTYATDVPLLLGLVIDTSSSMDMILTEAKRAGSGFLSQVLTEGDRAFLVDFSTRPRLRHRATGDLMELIGAFGGMRADGATALYDAILFSLVEFTDGPGRRALVMLTDGDDYRSHFGPNRAIRAARLLGVPVYVIALGRTEERRGGLSGTGRLEIEAVTRETGGRLYLIREVGELDRVYAEINAELRSQYLLTFYAQEDGDGEVDRDEIDLDVRRRGAEARVVVGAQ